MLLVPNNTHVHVEWNADVHATPQKTTGPPGSTITSCTVEMADTSTRVECAVIDEIQLIGS